MYITRTVTTVEVGGATEHNRPTTQYERKGREGRGRGERERGRGEGEGRRGGRGEGEGERGEGRKRESGGRG